MSSVQEIEREITELSAQELEELHAWMEEQYPQPIDARLKSDLEGGRMDSRIRQALQGVVRWRLDGGESGIGVG